MAHPTTAGTRTVDEWLDKACLAEIESVDPTKSTDLRAAASRKANLYLKAALKREGEDRRAA